VQIHNSLVRHIPQKPGEQEIAAAMQMRATNAASCEGTEGRGSAMSLKDRIPVRKSYKFLPWFLTAAFMLFTAAQLFSQLEDGRISGIVRDVSGAVG
jgi:hypothetical protein